MSSGTTTLEKCNAFVGLLWNQLCMEWGTKGRKQASAQDAGASIHDNNQYTFSWINVIHIVTMHFIINVHVLHHATKIFKYYSLLFKIVVCEDSEVVLFLYTMSHDDFTYCIYRHLYGQHTSFFLFFFLKFLFFLPMHIVNLLCTYLLLFVYSST